MKELVILSFSYKDIKTDKILLIHSWSHHYSLCLYRESLPSKSTSDSTIGSFSVQNPDCTSIYLVKMEHGLTFQCVNGTMTRSKTISTVISDLAVVYDTAKSRKDVKKFPNYAQDRDKQGKIVTIGDSHRMKSPDFQNTSGGITRYICVQKFSFVPFLRQGRVWGSNKTSLAYIKVQPVMESLLLTESQNPPV